MGGRDREFEEIHLILSLYMLNHTYTCRGYTVPESDIHIYRFYGYAQIYQNRMTGTTQNSKNLEFQFESNSSSTSDYTVFFSTKPSKMLLMLLLLLLLLYSLFLLQSEGKCRNKEVNP